MCGADIARAMAVDPPAGDVGPLIHLRTLCTFHDMGWTFCGNEIYQYEHLFLDVLHRTCEFLSGRHGNALLNVALEGSHLPSLELQQGIKEFERRPLVARHILILAALWLLLDWPERFFRCCTAARVTMSQFCGDKVMPWWFRSGLIGKLGKFHYEPTSEEARGAAAYLETLGHRVSGLSVRGLIGGGDTKASKAYRVRSAYPWPRTAGEFANAFKKLDARISALEPNSPRHLIATRDRVILRVMQATGWRPQRVLDLTTTDLRYKPSSGRFGEQLSPEIRGVLMCYMKTTRRRLAGSDSGNAMFIGWHSKGIRRNSLAAKSEFYIPAVRHHA